MTLMSKEGRDLLGASVRCLSIAGIAGVCLFSKAQAETIRSVQATATTAYDSNPFLFFGNDTETASFRLEIEPNFSRVDEVSSLTVSAQAEYIEYAQNYESVQNGSITLSASEKISERLDVSASFLVSSAIQATGNDQQIFGQGPDGNGPPVLPIANDLLLDDDLTLLGQRQRINSVIARGSLSFALNQYDTIEWSTVTSLQRFASGSGLIDSDYTEQRLGINHKFSDDLVVGGSVATSFSNFKNGGQGDARVALPQIFFRAQLNPRITATGNVGIAFTQIESNSGAATVMAFSGNGSVCYQGTRSNFCLTGQRQVLPSAIGEVLIQTVVGATYSVRLSERDTLQFGGNYSQASTPFEGASRDFESIQVYSRFERTLRERIKLFANAGYSDTVDNLGGRRSNIQGSIGITIRFGNSR